MFKLDSGVPVRKQQPITNWLMQKKSLDESLSMLPAKDGLTFRQIAQSEVIRQGFQVQRFQNIPTSPNGVVSRINSFAESVLSKDKEEIDIAKAKQKFSVIFDEWSLIRNRRYLNVVLLGKEKFWNLGLVRIYGSATASCCLSLVKSKLKDFNIHFDEDVLSIITDGCSTMKCIGKLIVPMNQQLCFAHAIQLAVLDNLYEENSGLGREAVAFQQHAVEFDENDDDWHCDKLALKFLKRNRFL